MSNIPVYVITKNWVDLPSKITPINAVDLSHIEQGIKNVTDFVNELNAGPSGFYLYLSEVPFTDTLKTKLDGIEAQANKYILPTASTSTKGGVKIDGSTILIDENGVIRSVGGGGGASALSQLTDVVLNSLQDGQVIFWDNTNEKWVNTFLFPDRQGTLDILNAT